MAHVVSPQPDLDAAMCTQSARMQPVRDAGHLGELDGLHATASLHPAVTAHKGFTRMVSCSSIRICCAQLWQKVARGMAA